jgi:FSR family fosmidomycin resistance protein-like MFS transporter
VRAELDKRAMAALSSGHLATDFANGALPALLPFFVDKFDLSYTLAAAAILASAVSSSIVQPLFGLWSDRRGAVWLLPAGVALAGIGIALAAVAPSYWLVLLFVVFSGLGVAAFHPEGSKFAAFVGGSRRASAMSLFSIGGNLGFALGPTVATPLVLAFGLEGGLLLAVPCLVVAAVLLRLARYLGSFASERGRSLAAEGRDRVGAGERDDRDPRIAPEDRSVRVVADDHGVSSRLRGEVLEAPLRELPAVADGDDDVGGDGHRP